MRARGSFVCVYGRVSEKLMNWGKGIKENWNRMGDSNLPQIKQENVLKLGFLRHLGAPCALPGHMVVRCH